MFSRSRTALATSADLLCGPAAESYRHTTTINLLPEDVFLDIFQFVVSEWQILVHVCRRWRRIIFSSPRGLDLTILCTYGTPVKKNLGYWPPFPIIVDYFTWSGTGSPPNYEDDVTAALEHPDRVRIIKLTVTSSLLAKVALVVQEPFPAMTTLWLSSKDRIAPIIPDVFLSSTAPHLQQIYLAGVSFPALPALLLSASDLVDLELKDIPQGSYLSPEAMTTSLVALSRLNTLCIWFKSPISRHQQRYSPSSARGVLPSLTAFNFRGSSAYLEYLLARIDTPRLHSFKLTFFNQLDFQLPQFSQFIRRTESLELAQSRYAQVRVRISNLYIELGFEEKEHSRSCLTLRISCQRLDWQVSHVAQIFDQSPAMVSYVDHLFIDEVDLQLDPGWKDDMGDTDWLRFLRPFTDVKLLHGSKQLAGHIARALDGVSGEVVTEVLPSLESLLLQDQPEKSITQFIGRRRLSSRPVMFADSYPTYIPNSQNDVLLWTSQDPRQSLLLCQLGVVYRFQTDTNAQGQSVTELWRAIRSNKGGRVAKLIWAPGGGLGRAVIGKNIWSMDYLVRRDPLVPNSRVFRVPTVSSTSGDRVRTARTSCYKLPITM